MPSSSKPFAVGKRHWVILAVWLSFTYAAFAYVVNKQLVDFDPSGWLATTSHKVIKESLEANLSINTQGRSVVHFTQANCHCQQFSDRHVESIDKLANKADFNISRVELSSETASKAMIPSTPAVAIIEKGELVYLGPYGAGVGCSEVSGFAQTVLNNVAKGFSDNILISDAKGCYCQTT
ncbi:MAG: hypothetical protein CL811_04175 [Colwelliaceae bacterium]|nr:hypothetical protein [Colwelliaceae bacterium]